MKTVYKILFFVTIISAAHSCTDNVDLNQEYLTAIISDYDLNTKTCVVKVLDKNVEKILGISASKQYNAVNLPKSNENILGKLIKIKARLAAKNEIPVGTTLYAENNYPDIYVVELKDYSFGYNDTVQLNVNNLIQSYDNRYAIRFDSVFTDSRCPEGAQCIWSGVAGVRFTLSGENAEKKVVQLYTANNIEWSDSVVYNNLKIKLLEVTPYPSLTSKFDYSAYIAKIKISKIK